MLSTIFEQFVQMSPVSVMARGLMERIFAPDRMNQLFATHAQRQHQQELLFSSQVAMKYYQSSNPIKFGLEIEISALLNFWQQSPSEPLILCCVNMEVEDGEQSVS
jgi:hypothetical protein